MLFTKVKILQSWDSKIRKVGFIFEWSISFHFHRRSACSNSCLPPGRSSCSCWTFLNAVWSLDRLGSSWITELGQFSPFYPLKGWHQNAEKWMEMEDHETKFFSHHGIGIQKSVFHHFMEIWWDMTLESIHFHPQKSYSWVSDAKALVQLGRCFWKASYKAQSAACGTRWNPLCCKSKQNGARDPSISQREKQSLLLSIFIIFYLHFLVFHQVEMICLKPKLKCSTVPSHQPSRFLSIVSHGVGSMSLPHGHWIWWCVSNPACAILINFHWPTLYYVELCRYISNLTPFESFW